MTIQLSADECCSPGIGMDDIVAWITREAKRNLECDGCGPGGLRAKIHAMSMKLDRRIGDVMRDV